MNFPDTADKKKEDVKEAGEVKSGTVNKDNGGIYNYSLINFTFSCLQCRKMKIILFSNISNDLFSKH